jgi:DNA mismatch endonuclease (patch repair protein)
MKTPDAARSRTMRAVKSHNTKPELIVRKLAHAMGYRFRLHRKDLPGSPDIVFPGRRRVIFVHGCFWHGHDCKRGSRQPKDNADYWRGKISKNISRDQRVTSELINQGWRPIIVWECELRDLRGVQTRLKDFLEDAGNEESPELRR